MIVTVNLIGVALIAWIIWWFWIWQPSKAIKAGKEPVLIVVDQGVYNPDRIEVPLGKPTTLRFLRQDPSPCAEYVVIEALGLNVELPIGRERDIVITPPQPGNYSFTCQMQMYRGELIVR